MCTFLDYDPWFRADRTGHNKVGYLTNDDLVVFPIRRHCVRLPAKTVAKKMRGKKLVISKVQWPEDHEAGVEMFFTQNVLNPDLMARGLSSILKRDFDFFRCPIKLPVLTPISPEEHENRWSQMMKCIQPSDLIQVMDSSNIVSRLIAKFDIGTWSHSAGYAGQGMVLEAITSGVVRRSINVYNDVRYRLGVYRLPGITKDQQLQILLSGGRHLGCRYSWKGVFRLGAKKLLRLKRNKYREGEVSPNDLISLGAYELIHIV